MLRAHCSVLWRSLAPGKGLQGGGCKRRPAGFLLLTQVWDHSCVARSWWAFQPEGSVSTTLEFFCCCKAEVGELHTNGREKLIFPCRQTFFPWGYWFCNSVPFSFRDDFILSRKVSTLIASLGTEHFIVLMTFNVTLNIPSKVEYPLKESFSLSFPSISPFN